VVARNNKYHTIIASSHHTYIGAILSAHSVHGCTCDAAQTKGLQQHPLLLIMNCTDRRFFLWKLHLALPSHPGHSTILLQSGGSSGQHIKIHTVAANNKRDCTMLSLN